jgi:hypothetical protein
MKPLIYSFTNGFLYLFGLSSNPAESIQKEYFQKSDTERLLGDWYKIGNDISKSYEACEKPNS